ncbi:helix-turn-helix domain-containing protein [Natrialba aegyptia]|uniref:Bacterio-opsin activator HTH domain-containing protein n=1 Tax=Natrialba aegyptia DSM 13077 TaxID=1227491 RepID=M0BLI3_9EURY|nr:helix-turn-helix domain-containing protein [Natrialba aegyptia]ELZ10469.1 bacterio-opsin activator HTH domain-containing protein [Natrialba aegyptia DSM 13077]
MAQATLTLTLPDHVWIQQVSAAHPNTTFRVLAAVPDTETGFALVRLSGPAVEHALQDMNSHPQLTELTLTQRSDGEATVHFETTEPLLLFSSRDAGMPIELPVTIQDGRATVTVTGSRDRLAELAEQFDRLGLQYQIDTVSEQLHESQLLSDRQLEVLVTAVREGYYDTPRRCSLTDLADHLGIAKSTCSETLHRAEEAIIKRFVDQIPETTADESLEEPFV